MLLGYSIMSSVVISIMYQVTELCCYLPVNGGHIRLSGRFVDPALSATMSVNYIVVWVLIQAAELSATATLFSFWKPLTADEVSPAVWIAIGMVSIRAHSLRLFNDVDP